MPNSCEESPRVIATTICDALSLSSKISAHIARPFEDDCNDTPDRISAESKHDESMLNIGSDSIKNLVLQLQEENKAVLMKQMEEFQRNLIESLRHKTGQLILEEQRANERGNIIEKTAKLTTNNVDNMDTGTVSKARRRLAQAMSSDKKHIKPRKRGRRSTHYQKRNKLRSLKCNASGSTSSDVPTVRDIYSSMGVTSDFDENIKTDFTSIKETMNGDEPVNCESGSNSEGGNNVITIRDDSTNSKRLFKTDNDAVNIYGTQTVKLLNKSCELLSDTSTVQRSKKKKKKCEGSPNEINDNSILSIANDDKLDTCGSNNAVALDNKYLTNEAGFDSVVETDTNNDVNNNSIISKSDDYVTVAKEQGYLSDTIDNSITAKADDVIDKLGNTTIDASNSGVNTSNSGVDTSNSGVNTSNSGVNTSNSGVNTHTLQDSTSTSVPSPPKFREAIASLGVEEWENEIARNILSLYKANLTKTTALSSEEVFDNDAVFSHDHTAVTSVATTSKHIKDNKKQGKMKLKKPSKKSKNNFHNVKGRSAKLRRRDIISTANTNQSEMRSIQIKHQIRKSNSKLIWFSGAGLTHAVWCGLAVQHEDLDLESEINNKSTFNTKSVDCKHKLCGELVHLESKGKFRKYIAITEGLLQARIRVFGVSELEVRQWKQLTVTCNVFAQRCIDEKKFGLAMELLQKAEWLGQEEIIDDEFDRMELKAFVDDTYGYYYHVRKKSHAALQYVKRACVTHSKLNQWNHVAKGYLHRGAILAHMRKYDDSIRVMGQILTLVENDKLESGGASAQKICLVAVCYHNIAVMQLQLEKAHEACVSSQNARRLARLSLSYSNRWLHVFESTHAGALAMLSEQKQIRSKFRNLEQAKLFNSLTTGLYN